MVAPHPPKRGPRKGWVDRSAKKKVTFVSTPHNPHVSPSRWNPPPKRGIAHPRRPRPPHRVRASSSSSPPPPPATTEEAIPIALSFGAFEFHEMRNLGQRGGGVRELSQCLRSAREQKRRQELLMQTNDGAEQRQKDLLQRAARRAVGEKMKDDPARISKALAKRRSQKRQSAKKWAKRIEALQHSVDHCVEERENNKYKGKKGRKNKEDKKGKNGKKGKNDRKKDTNYGKKERRGNTKGGTTSSQKKRSFPQKNGRKK